jgi:beta-glucosidase
LGDRVAAWITHNEPWVAAFMGHYTGEHAPGTRHLSAALTAAHHLLLSHGLATQAYRGTGLAAPIGITLDLAPVHPNSDEDEDHEAAATADGYGNRWFLDAIRRGAYPADMVALFERLAGPPGYERDGDAATIASPIDFLGVNYYRPTVAAADRTAPMGYRELDGRERGVPATDMGWEIAPEGLTELLLAIKRDYGPLPLYVTENGAAYGDEPGPDGSVDDDRRVEYLRSHFSAAEDAIAAGVDLRGYFVWSFMDNFEWAEGYSKRFGVVYVDYATQRRIPKTSARFLAEVSAANVVPAGER